MSSGSRPCDAVEIPTGPAGVAALMPSLAAALDGSGPAIALVPGEGSGRYARRIRDAVRPGEPVSPDVAVIASTSGSTGDPAGVLLPAEALRAAADGFAARSGHRHRWVAALPLHHAGGLMVAVRAHLAGTLPVPTASLGGAEPFTLEAFARATRRASEESASDGRPLAVSLVPAMLGLLDAAGEAGWDLLAEYDAVLVGGAAPPRPVVDRLRVAGVHVFTSYGMTETCGGAVLDGRPLPGVRVGADARGRLRISGAQVALGYRDGRQPERWGAEPDGTRSFLTDDLGRVLPDGAVTVTGRVDDVVQVGGASVALAAVAAVLRDDPRVDAAEVVALPDDRFGCRLVALVVARSAPASGELPDAEHLAEAVEAALGRAARPRSVRLVRAIPLLESGKPDRAALAALAAAPDHP
jgi:O-succinylbenzoic acid--CoA ligase